MTDLRGKIKEIVEDSYNKGDEYWEKKYGEKTYIDSILSLFSEIAKEAVGEMDNTEDTWGICRDNVRSEILSNIEKVI